MASKQSMTLSQFYNPRHSTNPEHPTPDEPEYLYKVERAVNTLVEHIGSNLKPDRVQDLIESGVDVTIVPTK